MGIFKRKNENKLSLHAVPGDFGYSVSLRCGSDETFNLTYESILQIEEKQLEASILSHIAVCLQSAGKLQLDHSSNELSREIKEGFDSSEIDYPLVSLVDGALLLSYLGIASARAGNLQEIAGIGREVINALQVPEYYPIKSKVHAHSGVEKSGFRVELETFDLNGVPKKITHK